MPELPFEIPESLSSYAEHYDKDPQKAIKRLNKQLKKRGPDAVGHFLLAWLYHLEGLDDKAVDAALQAKIFAPGSPFLNKLHYYLSHPENFDAWTPDSTPSLSRRAQPGNSHSPVMDLDNLIQKLSAIESKKIKPKTSKPPEPGEIEEEPDDVDNIVSETLAVIYEKQGKYETAIKAYSRLQKINKEKKDYYEDKIEELKKERESKEKEKN